MPKPVTWVLVADAARARLFQLEQPELKLTPVLGRELIGTNLPSREIASDRPGRTFDRGGQGRHAKEPSTDPARHAQDSFAHDIARRLEDKQNRHAFQRLIVVAPPRFLGDLRAVMSDGLREVVIVEITKDLSHSPPDELREHIRQALAA